MCVDIHCCTMILLILLQLAAEVYVVSLRGFVVHITAAFRQNALVGVKERPASVPQYEDHDTQLKGCCDNIRSSVCIHAGVSLVKT